MGGGLIQIVAYGSQDVYLSGNPHITFFKVVYRRHTVFALESIDQTYTGSAGNNRKVSIVVARNGDLLAGVWIEVHTETTVRISGLKKDSTSMFPFITPTSLEEAQSFIEQYPSIILQHTGFRLIDYVEVEIGGQIIDKHYGDWMAIWCDLTHTMDQTTLLGRLTDIHLTPTIGTIMEPTPDEYVYTQRNKLSVPLTFWFCRNPGLALPLIALQYHEVKLHIQLADRLSDTRTDVVWTDTGLIDDIKANILTTTVDIQDCIVWCDYVYLDTDERRRFAQVSHEYLITQVQFSNDLGTLSDIVLRFNHPLKELIWTLGHDRYTNYGGVPPTDSPTATVLLQLNGHDRMIRRTQDTFTQVQRYQYHRGAGRLPNVSIYSFGLYPEEHQPSGTANFSRIDNVVLHITEPPATTIKVYAVNYNILRIQSGMAGVLFAN